MLLVPQNLILSLKWNTLVLHVIFPIIFKCKLTGEESLSDIDNVLINVFTELIPLSIFLKEKIQFLHSMCVYNDNVVQILTSVYALLVVFIWVFKGFQSQLAYIFLVDVDILKIPIVIFDLR